MFFGNKNSLEQCQDSTRAYRNIEVCFMEIENSLEQCQDSTCAYRNIKVCYLHIKNSLEQCQDSTCTYMVQFPGLETPEYLPNGLQV